MLAQIVQMVAQAQRSRAPIQRLADRVSAWFVPLVIAVALLAFAAWAVFGPEPRFAYGLVAAVAVLIIACPCALGLATPMSIMVGVGRGAQAGVLIKNAESLERMEKIDTLVVDKTGTLTEGKPKVVAVIPAKMDSSRRNFLRSRPACRATQASIRLRMRSVDGPAERDITLAPVTDFEAPTGKGRHRHLVEASRIRDRERRLHQGVYLDRTTLEVKPNAALAEARPRFSSPSTATLAGVVAIADPIKVGASRGRTRRLEQRAFASSC